MSLRQLKVLHAELDRCTRCSDVVGPVVHGQATNAEILLVGQAPGTHEGRFGKPFAWTAGKTLFKWLHSVTGADEETLRERIHIAAVTRCFPGKASGGGDLKPSLAQIENCKPFLAKETQILKPKLIIPVGTMAIFEVMGHKGPLVEVVGKVSKITFHGVRSEVIALPHPSGASTWHRRAPGNALLTEALAQIGAHPAVLRAFQG